MTKLVPRHFRPILQASFRELSRPYGIFSHTTKSITQSQPTIPCLNKFVSYSSLKNDDKFKNSPASPDNIVVEPKKKLGFKELMKKYGFPAFIVYNGLSAIDLSITFCALHFSGDEYVLYIEALVKSWVEYFQFGESTNGVSENTAVAGSEVSIREKPSTWTTFLVAYSFHKLLVPLRVPLTGLLTPSFTRKMQQYGFFLKKPPQN